MFWSVSILPLEHALVVWDTAGSSVQCRHLGNLTLKWEIRGIRQADCLTIAGDKNHVYMSDYSDGPAVAAGWMRAIAGQTHTSVDKFFVVADGSTGKVLANVTIGRGVGMTASLVVGGANGDVFIGFQNGLARIHSDE